jgi:hypothetical protein
MNPAGVVDDLARVRIDPELAWTLVGYLGGTRRRERGGVLLGTRTDLDLRIVAAVFPPQLADSTVHCAFDVGSIDLLRRALTAMTAARVRQDVGTIVGWVHSHPDHGLFLSDTDVETLASWLNLDVDAVALVIDPFLSGRFQQRMAWWGRQRVRGTVIDAEPTGALTMPRTATLAQAIRDHAAFDHSWDVASSRCVIRVFPPAGSGPEPARNRRAASW